jgi:hypothetical protein
MPRPLVLALIHPSAWNMFSRKFISKIVHSPALIPLESPTPGAPHSLAPLELVTLMDRYARLWMSFYRKQTFAATIIPQGGSYPSPHS